MVILGVVLLVIAAIVLVDMGATSHGTTDLHLLGWHLGNAGPGRVLLLGVLTLTARFHPDLVAYHSNQAKPNNPIDASEYYATALKTAFGPTGSHLTSPSIDTIQALLMLGLYEWGQTRGLSAWVFTGIAMRLAQSMGLAYEDGPDNRDFKPTLSRKTGTNVRENAIEKEVRRRTLWSCFVMDRMLSSGK